MAFITLHVSIIIIIIRICDRVTAPSQNKLWVIRNISKSAVCNKDLSLLEKQEEKETQNGSFGVIGKGYLFIGPHAGIVVSGGQAKAWLVELVQRITTHNHTIHSKQEIQCIHSTSKKKKKKEKVSVTMIKIIKTSHVVSSKFQKQRDYLFMEISRLCVSGSCSFEQSGSRLNKQCFAESEWNRTEMFRWKKDKENEPV